MASPLVGYNTNVRHHGKLFHIQTEDSGVTHGHIFTHLFADGGRIVATKKSSYSEWVGTDRYPASVKKLMQAQHKAMFIALRDGLFDADEAAGAKTFLAQQITIDEGGGGEGGAGSGKGSGSGSGKGSGSSSGSAAAATSSSRSDLDIDALDRAAAAYLSKAPSFAGDATVPGALSPEPVRAPIPAAPPAAGPSRARLDPTPVQPQPAVRAVPTPAALSAQRAAVASPAAATPRSNVGRYQETQPAAPVQASAPPPRSPSPAQVGKPVSKKGPEPSVFGSEVLTEKSLDEVIMSYLAEDLDEKD